MLKMKTTEICGTIGLWGIATVGGCLSPVLDSFPVDRFRRVPALRD